MALAQASVVTQKKTKVLERLGLTYDDISPSLKGFAGVIDTVKDSSISGEDA